MAAPRTAATAKAPSAPKAKITLKVEGMQQTIGNFKVFFDAFDTQVIDLKEDIARELLLKNNAIQSRNNLYSEHEGLCKQLVIKKAADLKSFESLKEDNAELVDDKIRVVLRNEALQRKIDHLEADTTQQDQSQKLLNERNDKIQRLEEEAKVRTKEIELLQGVERKFILEHDKNVQKDVDIEKLSDKYSLAKLERAGLLKTETGYLLREAKLKGANSALENANKNLMIEVGRLDELEKETRRLQACVAGLEEQAFKSGATHKVAIKEDEFLRGKIQAMGDDHSDTLADARALRNNHTAAIEENESLKTQIQGLGFKLFATLADVQSLHDNHMTAIEENEALKAEVSVSKTSHQSSLAELENFKGRHQALEEDQGLRENHILAQQQRSAMITRQAPQAENDDHKAEVQALQSKIHELENEKKLTELTTLGASIRMAYLRFGRDPEVSYNVIGRNAYGKNIVADAAIFQTNFLTEEGAGELFQELYGHPIFAFLNYDAMPKYCQMLNLLTQFDHFKVQQEYPKMSLLPGWVKREKVIAHLQSAWDEVAFSNSMLFEGDGRVDSLLVKLEDLNQRLQESLIILTSEDEQDLLDM